MVEGEDFLRDAEDIDHLGLPVQLALLALGLSALLAAGIVVVVGWSDRMTASLELLLDGADEGIAASA